MRFVLEDRKQAEGELVRFYAPKTTDALLKRLPIEGRIARWKEEVYFETDIAMGLEKPRSKVEIVPSISLLRKSSNVS